MDLKRFRVACKRLLGDLEPICVTYGIPRLFFLIDAAFCFVRHGSSPRDYVNFEFYKINNIERKRFLTMRRAERIEVRLNDPSNAVFFNNKKFFNEKFSEFVTRKWIFGPESTDVEIQRFTKDVGKGVVKPLSMSSGKGIEVFHVDEISDWSAFCSRVRAGECLIEEFIIQHEAINRINQATVNTVRVYTLIDNKGICNIIFAAIRVGSGNAVVDNFHNGGIAYPIDLEAGRVSGVGIDIKGKEYLHHPACAIFMLGYEIPNWDGLIEFVTKAALVYPSSRYIAWDVAVVENGFEMIEGNYNGDPGLLQALDKGGKMQFFRKVM